MSFSFYIAKRYLFSKKSTNAINIIAIISTIGVCVGSAALVIILSVFNGFEALNIALYKRLSPDLQITATEGKVFDPTLIPLEEIKKIEGVHIAVEVLQDNALLKYGDAQYFATIKGVGPDFLKYKDLDSVLSAGRFMLQDDSSDYAVIGRGIEYALGIDVKQPVDRIIIYSPKKNSLVSTLNPIESLNRKAIFPAGMFSVMQEMDNEVMFVSLRFSRILFEEKQKISFIEIYLNNEDQIHILQSMIQQKVGSKFIVKNRYQLNELLYKILNTEKWAVYLILTFVLIIAICNIIGSVTMLVIDKKKDVAILISLGANRKTIRTIFLLEGLLISMLGAITGLLLGGFFVYLQEKFGLIKINASDNFFLQAYPVKFIYTDFTLVFVTVFVISFIASWVSSHQSIKNFTTIRDSLSD